MSLTFDDGTKDHVAGAQILANHGLAGTFFVNSGRVGTPGFMTLTDLNALSAQGHEIGGHSLTHANLLETSPAETKREICTDRANLTNWGFKVTSFAYPYSLNTTETQNITKECGYNSARGLGGIPAPDSPCPGCSPAETMPPANPYKTRAPGEIHPSWTLEDLQNTVTQAETTGGWLQLTIHTLDTSGTPYSMDPALLDTFASWLAARKTQGTTVKTIDQVIAAPAQPLGLSE